MDDRRMGYAPAAGQFYGEQVIDSDGDCWTIAPKPWPCGVPTHKVEEMRRYYSTYDPVTTPLVEVRGIEQMTEGDKQTLARRTHVPLAVRMDPKIVAADQHAADQEWRFRDQCSA